MSSPIADPVATDSAADLTPHESGRTARPGSAGRRIWHVFVAAAVLTLVVLLARTLMGTPQLPGHWSVDARGRVVLASASLPALQPAVGLPLESVRGGSEPPVSIDAQLLLRSTRWMADDARRAAFDAAHRRLDAALARGPVELAFADGSRVEVAPVAPGLAALGVRFWMMTALGCALLAIGLVVVQRRSSTRNVVYALMTGAQGVNLLLGAADSAFELSLPTWLLGSGELRMLLDLITTAAMVHSAAVAPQRMPGGTWIAGGVWMLTAVLAFAMAGRTLDHAWWWTQGFAAFDGLVVIGLLSWSYRTRPHPFALLMRRFIVVALAAWLLLTLAVAAALQARLPLVADVGGIAWAGLSASFYFGMPFLARSPQVVHELAIVTIAILAAAAIDLALPAVFPMMPLGAFALSMAGGTLVFFVLRRWLARQASPNSMFTAERMFEQLYRTAREIEQEPVRAPALLDELLCGLFLPLESAVVDYPLPSVKIIDDGSAMLVPVGELVPGAGPADAASAVLLRYAQRGRRLFTLEDAKLAGRIVEQLRRAVAFDQAVEQGRSEERTRIAQDLHDDIGARLLTLMYKAPSPEMEDYVRHTLQDLKTLTRGLAAPSHRLSDAIGEWKADIAQRLSVVHCDLGWSASFDHDVMLSVVQWSALTRVLRELISNTIAHAQSTRVDVDLSFENDRLSLTVADNGIGRQPSSWSHGLGLGGVRKRVKQLGGEVEWRENLEAGITCTVRIRDWSHKG